MLMTPRISSRTTVATADTRSDPAQPSRLEKKNTGCSYPRRGRINQLGSRRGAPLEHDVRARTEH